MIRINLLGVAKSKKARRPSFSMSGSGVNPTLIGLIVLLVVVGGNYWYLSYLNGKQVQLQTDLSKERLLNAQLASTKAKYQEREKQFQLYDRRVKVIHKLQEAQAGPTELLNTVANTVNSTDAVWLNSMNEEGNSINLVGTAISASAVANLITNLKKTDYFKSVEIKETYQDDTVKEIQAFTFTIVCEQKQKS
ncbi:MAG TPA: PilN domain-containing protein [Terriglobales bacterium]|nr:PilN domain-containing protein [Terriglobales bacterium]